MSLIDSCRIINVQGQVSLQGGPDAHPHADLVDAVATPVLHAAVPLLEKLRRPALAPLGQRLQCVVKAQRIILPGAKTTAEEDQTEYSGIWHVDGDWEHIVAVVLYYYHKDEALHGGAMEFCDRGPIDVIGVGDCSNNLNDFGNNSLNESLRGEDQNAGRIPACKVPVEEGTLLVFSNHQMVHRVLTMANRATREASRDFVALFVVDPNHPLVPAAAHLTTERVLRRILAPRIIPDHSEEPLTLILTLLRSPPPFPRSDHAANKARP